MKKLRDYQEKSQAILSRDTSGLDASGLGTGKTLTGVERVRRIAEKFLGRAPRVLVIAPMNTQKQWKALFAEQFPSLEGSPYLRIIKTPKTDPESWNDFLLKKKPGIFIIGWESMRGICPKQIEIIKQEAADRIAGAREDRRSAKQVLRRKRITEEERAAARQTIERAERDLLIRPGEQATTKGKPPAGWVPKDAGGASRGYGSLYKGNKLTVQAVKEAMKCGDIPAWHRTGTWDLIIADESHRMARRDSANKLVIKQPKTTHKLAMSATFSGNKEEGAWSTLNWLWPSLYSSFERWRDTFLAIEEIHIGGGNTAPKVIGEKEPGIVWLDIPCKVRHRVEDVRGELPDVIERTVLVDMDPKQRRIYDEFADQCLAWLDSIGAKPSDITEDGVPVLTALSIDQRIRMRQAALGTIAVTDEDPLEIGFNEHAPQPKIDMIADIISDLPEDEAVLVWTHSSKWALMAEKKLAKARIGTVRSWTGALTPKKREALKEDFGRGVRVIVAQIQAIGEGVDGLQRRCAAEIWASVLDGNVTVNEQAEGRLHRDGQTRPVQRWRLHSEDSIDTDLAESLELRSQRLKAMYHDKKQDSLA